jgi:cytochrome c oxidase subunit 2
MHKWFMFVLFIGASILGLGVLFQDISARQTAAAEEAAAAATQLKIVASNWKLDKPEYDVKAGETKKVVLTLAEGVHAIEIQGLGIKLDGQNRSQEVKFDKPGTYTIQCVLPCGQGHDQMKAKLVVQ